jgi:2-polyprenyl-3-methyl-5-hydroxy-6-metoxy-1,4-benzoquinol methylase
MRKLNMQEAKGVDHSSDPRFQAYYEEKSASTAAHDHFVRISEKVLRLLNQQFPGKTHFKVLDVGCNAGTQARIWAQLGHDVHGLDVNGPLLETARARAAAEGLPITFTLGTATSLPYAEQSMDAVLMLELLEHVQDWESCVNEAVRVLKPGGVLCMSTTNALCPAQQEFNLPMYSWYPGFVKRHYEKLAVTTRPELANHTRYPAVHWFTYYGLQRYLAQRNVRSLDRFQMLDGARQGGVKRVAIWALRSLPPVRLAGHLLTAGTRIMGVKNRGANG